MPGPKTPFKFYEAITIDLLSKNKQDKKSKKSNNKKESGDHILRFCRNDVENGVLIQLKESQLKGRCLAMLVDKDQNGWVAVRLLYSMTEAQSRGIQLPRDFDSMYELIGSSAAGTAGEGGIAVDTFSEDKMVWVPVCKVIGKVSLKVMQKSEFLREIKEGKIPKRGYYFMRPSS